jgi:hypothetical protein
MKRGFYPTIGLKKPGDHVFANFGQMPFQFDIDGYVKVFHLLSPNSPAVTALGVSPNRFVRGSIPPLNTDQALRCLLEV